MGPLLHLRHNSHFLPAPARAANGTDVQVSYRITVQLLEIYNETLRDLLVPEAEARQQRPLALNHTQRSGSNVPDAIQVRRRRRPGRPPEGPVYQQARGLSPPVVPTRESLGRLTLCTVPHCKA